jgi:hypothetical protein
MKNAIIAFACFGMIAAIGCHKNPAPDKGDNGAVTQSSAQTSPEELGRIGAEIEKHPKEANKVLSSHGMDQKTFEQAIRKVSNDPAASRRYAAAYKKSS